MTITPIDIQDKEFERAFRGYDMEDVDDFLDQIAKDLEDLLGENVKLREEIEQLRDKNKNYRQMEDTMQSAIVVAQRAADELKQKAAKDAAAVKAMAENEARKIIDQAKNRSGRVMLEHETLVKQMKSFKERFRSFIEAQLKTIDHESLFDELPGDDLSVPESADNIFEFEPAVRPEPLPETEPEEEVPAPQTEPEEDDFGLDDDLDLDYGLERDLDKEPEF